MRKRLKLVCGLDEAGRGALAGPVVAAAVVLGPRHRISGLKDSKKLSASGREALAQVIRSKALSWSVAKASAAEIKKLNVLQASLLAMRRAFLSLRYKGVAMDIVADGRFYPDGMPSGRALVRADATVPAVSAASILAKVHRDALMCELENKHPQFSFARHKGYPTPQHLRELAEYGPLKLHREHFAPVRRALQTRLLL